MLLYTYNVLQLYKHSLKEILYFQYFNITKIKREGPFKIHSLYTKLPYFLSLIVHSRGFSDKNILRFCSAVFQAIKHLFLPCLMPVCCTGLPHKEWSLSDNHKSRSQSEIPIIEANYRVPTSSRWKVMMLRARGRSGDRFVTTMEPQGRLLRVIFHHVLIDWSIFLLCTMEISVSLKYLRKQSKLFKKCLLFLFITQF